MPVESMNDRPARSTVRRVSPGSSSRRSSAGSTVNVAFMSNSPCSAARASAPSKVISTGGGAEERVTAVSLPGRRGGHAWHRGCGAGGPSVLVFVA